MAGDKGSFNCYICQLEKPLTTCKDCTIEMTMKMINRLLEEKPDEVKTQKMLLEVLDEIKSLKESLNEFKVKGLTLKASKKSYEELI